METIGEETGGSLTCESGVPGGTSTVTVSWRPSSNVSVSVRCSADAGITQTAPTARMAASEAVIASLRVVSCTY
jgi:hypothetical protein